MSACPCARKTVCMSMCVCEYRDRQILPHFTSQTEAVLTRHFLHRTNNYEHLWVNSWLQLAWWTKPISKLYFTQICFLHLFLTCSQSVSYKQRWLYPFQLHIYCLISVGKWDNINKKSKIFHLSDLIFHLMLTSRQMVLLGPLCVYVHMHMCKWAGTCACICLQHPNWSLICI
jgi:hypothetical protein